MGEPLAGRRALMGLIAATAAAPGLVLSAQTLPATSPADPLNYLDTAGRLTVQARVNGQGPFAFMVDTGANSSVIAAEIADQLGLTRGPRGEMHGIAGAQAVDTVRIEQLAVGRRIRKAMTLSVLPRSTLGADGILGLEWLGRSSLLLDYARRRMIVGEGLPVPDAQTFAVKARLQRSGLTLIDAFLPSRRVIAFVDSGSTTTVGNLALLEEALRHDSILGPTIETQLRSVTGQVLPGRLAVLSRLTLGKIILRRLPLVIGPIHTFDFWGMHDEPAMLIGSDILQKFQMVAMDFRAGEVRFRVFDH